MSLKHDSPTVQLHVWVKFQAEVYLPSPLQIQQLLQQDHDGCILGILKFTVFRRSSGFSLSLTLKYNKSPENRSRANLETLCISDQNPSIIKEQ